MAGRSDPEDDPRPKVFESPPWGLFESVVASAEHRDVAGAGRSAPLEWEGMVGVAVSYGPPAARETAPAITVLDQTPHRGRQSMTGATMPESTMAESTGARAVMVGEAPANPQSGQRLVDACTGLGDEHTDPAVSIRQVRGEPGELRACDFPDGIGAGIINTRPARIALNGRPGEGTGACGDVGGRLGGRQRPHAAEPMPAGPAAGPTAGPSPGSRPWSVLMPGEAPSPRWPPLPRHSPGRCHATACAP
jgi:hypothetical protein